MIYLLSGEIAKVDGTLFDLRKAVTLKDRLPQISGPPPGYDHNFCLGKSETGRTLAARVEHGTSGRVLEVLTDQPGIQFYTGNFLNGIPGKNGAIYGQHSAFALETQNFPDAINHVSTKSRVSFEASHIFILDQSSSAYHRCNKRYFTFFYYLKKRVFNVFWNVFYFLVAKCFILLNQLNYCIKRLSK